MKNLKLLKVPETIGENVVKAFDALTEEQRADVRAKLDYVDHMLTASTGAEALVVKIQALSPKDDRQRSIQAQALSIVMGLAQTRWLMYEQEANSVSKPMLVILVFWLAAIFVSFGLFAPRNATVITALFVAGLSVSGAIFLILELYAPFGGLIEISSGPLRATLTRLGQ